MKNQNINALNTLGQSVWYDNLSRDVLNSGELKGFIDQGVSGLTSNPTIFKNAIADSSNYDDEMKACIKKGLNNEDLCFELMVEDVGRAADLLAPVYKSSNRTDGYASIEVSPFLAANTMATIEMARSLWKKLNRPNIMIKVPATKEGLPAIYELLDEGINVNITLIFSREVYEQVAHAYINALEARDKRGAALGGLASVASFFVSRVDAICEKSLDQLIAQGKAKAEVKERMLGRIGIANSKYAYEGFEKLFGSARFKALSKKGALVQRPLWASTGTKNPAFSPVLYVEELAGKDTVNTMPPQTVKALIEKATIEPRLHKGLDEAKKIIVELKHLGVPFEELLFDLQVQGVKLFADAYTDLLGSIDKKRAKLG